MAQKKSTFISLFPTYRGSIDNTIDQCVSEIILPLMSCRLRYRSCQSVRPSVCLSVSTS